KSFGSDGAYEIVKNAGLFIDSKYAAEKIASVVEAIGAPALDAINAFAASNPAEQRMIAFLKDLTKLVNKGGPQAPPSQPRIHKR
ncbi:MAG TPA: hypothetical protein DC017_16725, partial [Candidatus Wallbacteria bacterium]|nr:hypothetical protein [Candidatus Wallbacteria bacterium]